MRPKKPDRTDKMYITDPNGDAKVEALLAGWEIGPSG